MEFIQKLLMEYPQISVALIGASLDLFLLEGRDRDPIGDKKIKKPVAIGCLILFLAGSYVLYLKFSGKLM